MFSDNELARHLLGAGQVDLSRRILRGQPRPEAFWDLRDTESMTTAPSSTPPVIMYWIEAFMFSRSRPVVMDWMTSMPRRADHTEPRPPKRLVPPMTAAAMASISVLPPPAFSVALAVWPAKNMPPRAAKPPEMANTVIRTIGTLMPARRAASMPPPTAKTLRPYVVRRSTKSTTTNAARKITRALETPAELFSVAAATKDATASRPARSRISLVGRKGTPAALRRR